MYVSAVATISRSATARNLCGGFPNDEDIGNNPVHGGDASLGGSDPNFTITDKAGTTYKLNIPPSADTSKLGQHVGESVAVAGNVNAGKAGNASIDVQGIGRGTGKCPASGSSGPQPPPKQ